MVVVRRAVIALALAAFCGVPAVAQRPAATAPVPLKLAPQPTTAAITVPDLMTRMYVFADDSMLGRLPGTLGEHRATAYLERELRRLGLTPAGEADAYVQAVPLVSRVASAQSTLSVGGSPLALWADFTLVRGTTLGPTRQQFVATPVIFGGAFGDSTRWITSEQAAGKVVVLAYRDGIGPVLTRRFNRALAVITDNMEALPPSTIAALRRPRLFRTASAGDLPPGPFQLRVTRAAAARLFGRGPVDTLRPGTRGGTLYGELMWEDEPVTGRNIVALLPGAGARRREYVALMAHHDALGWNSEPVDGDSLHAFLAELERRVPGSFAFAPASADQRAAIRVNLDSLRLLRPARPDSIFNGAEDDASGAIALLEIAEALTTAGAERLKRSVLFIWHTAEESGLLGARWYTDHPTVPLDSIVTVINVDGFGRWKSTDYRDGRGPRTHVVGSRRHSTELGEIVERVNASAQHPLLLDYTFDSPGHPVQVYCQGDSYMYARYGVPSVYLTDPFHPDIHQVTDEPQYIDFPGTAVATRFVHALVRHVANAASRPALNLANPRGSHAACPW